VLHQNWLHGLNLKSLLIKEECISLTRNLPENIKISKSETAKLSISTDNIIIISGQQPASP
jgi:hypothetical protein